MFFKGVRNIVKAILLRDKNLNILSYQLYNINNIDQKLLQETFRFHTNLTTAQFLATDYRVSPYTRTEQNHGKCEFRE